MRLIKFDKLIIRIYSIWRTFITFHLSIGASNNISQQSYIVKAILSSHGKRVISVLNDKMWFLCWRQKWNVGTAFHCHWCNSLDCQRFNWLWRKLRVVDSDADLNYSPPRHRDGYCSLTNNLIWFNMKQLWH